MISESGARCLCATAGLPSFDFRSRSFARKWTGHSPYGTQKVYGTITPKKWRDDTPSLPFVAL